MIQEYRVYNWKKKQRGRKKEDNRGIWRTGSSTRNLFIQGPGTIVSDLD